MHMKTKANVVQHINASYC